MDKHTVETLAKLDEQGKTQLRRGQWTEAIQTFSAMLELEDHPMIRNNLATAYYSSGQLQEAWAALKPELDQGVFGPYSWALASMIAFDLGRSSEAREYLERAIALFELGGRDPEELGFDPDGWWEYTVIIKRAAGHLGDHRLIVDLHRRWERFYRTPEDFFQAGVALFNLHYPLEAAEVWSQVRDRQWSFLQAYISVAKLVDQGLVPSFTLPYSPPEFRKPENSSSEDVQKLLSHGGNRVLVLDTLFTPGFPREAAQQSIRALASLGEWGSAFAHSLFQSSMVPQEWKFAAGMGLLDQGALQPGEPVTMLIDGVEQEVRMTVREVAPNARAERETLRQAEELFLAGEYEQVKDLLIGAARTEKLSLEGLQILARAHIGLGELEQALAIVDLFAGLGDQGYDLGYLVAADLCSLCGLKDRAWEYLTLVSYSKLKPGAQQTYRRIKEQLAAE
ncbi:MAG TPA: hypothetical protein PLM25_00620 [Limnochordia bacterium]|nr:hypothetical protein [Limnochordia bacterium]